jgi:hypothetical protein
MVTTPSGLQYRDVVVGTGPQAQVRAPAGLGLGAPRQTCKGRGRGQLGGAGRAAPACHRRAGLACRLGERLGEPAPQPPRPLSWPPRHSRWATRWWCTTWPPSPTAAYSKTVWSAASPLISGARLGLRLWAARARRWAAAEAESKAGAAPSLAFSSRQAHRHKRFAWSCPQNPSPSSYSTPFCAPRSFARQRGHGPGRGRPGRGSHFDEGGRPAPCVCPGTPVLPQAPQSRRGAAVGAGQLPRGV